MRFTLSILLLCGLFVGAAARAESDSEHSRGFQLARRVASVENEQSVPSRAAWISNRVVETNRTLAFQQTPKPVSKKPTQKE